MTTLKQLYDLQELDQETSECRDRITAIERRLGDRSEIDALAKRREGLKESIDRLTVRHRSESKEAESLKVKVDEVEARLYSGSIKSVKEMEGFQKEASFLREQLQVLDERVLESMVALDEAQRGIEDLDARSVESEERWQLEQVELGRELKERRADLSDLEGRRDSLAAQVSGQDIRLYERLRVSKKGWAVAKVQGGMCRACGMALPTHQLQRARTGREPVLCNSCGRILFMS